ncbi:MAG: serine hydroxymethyltransferase [Candidatus Parcubacteria bacterium]|nr:serine hydroxymethyltransferase [Candidatus Parcubacteria bacterium]
MKYLAKSDSQINTLVSEELKRQKDELEMIASENYASEAVLETMGTVLSNKYSEGYPDKRYYGGNQIIDKIEQLAINRAQTLFEADHANVQPHSGSQANQAVYLALLNPGDKILAMDLACGGHLSHGAKVNLTGKIYDVYFYGVDKETGLINYDDVAKLAKIHKPKLIIAGATAYPRQINFDRFRQIADSVGAYLMVDMAHFAGLVAAKVYPDPVPFADVVTSTTHKTLRGPRGGFILCKKHLGEQIDKAVFPGLQGGPLDNIIAAKAVCFKEAAALKFKKYQEQIIRNAKILSLVFANNGIKIITNGTDTHLILLDVTSIGLSGGQAEKILEKIGIIANKNLIPYDTRSAKDPSGLRLGTPALTTRGMKENEMKTIGQMICDLLKNPNDKKIVEKSKKKVKELTKKFPIYKDLEY